MKKEKIYELKDFTAKLKPDTLINLHGKRGYSEDVLVQNLTEVQLNEQVIGWKQKKKTPQFRFKVVR